MLEALQHGFLDTLRGSAPRLPLGPSKIAAEQTWAIYRRNYLEGHIAALADTYGTVLKLVGADYFSQLARRYAAQAESRSGDLNDYGAGFADFLAELLPTAPGGDALPYLPDLARFDWAWFEVLRAPHRPVDWLFELLGLPAARWPQAKALAAGHCLCSAYPIYRIWRLTEGDEAAVELNSGGEALLIARPGPVRVSLLNAAEAAFVSRWFSGDSLETALEAALVADGDFDLPTHLTKLAALGAVRAIESESC